MKDEIKEILDKFDKVLKNYELDKKFGQMSVDSICHLFPSEMMVIKDYITNLQGEIEKLTAESTEWESKCYNLQEENERLKEVINDDMTVYLKGLEDGKDKMKECYDSIYKSRNEKAIKYIKDSGITFLNLANQRCFCNNNCADKIINILNGDNEDGNN